jgi:uncharacterized membrane protein
MVAPLVALVAAAWLALLVATPLLPTPIAALTYAVGSFICHQLPERSFHLSGFQLPVCARCLGIYAGLAIGVVSHRVLRSDPVYGSTQPLESPRHRGLTPQWILGIAAVPTIVTVGLEWIDAWRASNVSRALAGSTLGIGIALVVMSALATLHYSPCAPRRPTESSPPPRI